MPIIETSCATTLLESEALRLLNLRTRIGHGHDDVSSAYSEFMSNDGDFLRTYLGDGGLLATYREWRRDINKLLAETQGIGGRPPRYMPGWRDDDPLALTKHNRRLLAEFGLREAMKRVYHRHNGETSVHQEAPNVGRETWQGGGSFDYGAVLSDWASRYGLASSQRVSQPPGVSSEILPPTGPTGSPVGEH
jgi:hypothetical protein